LVDNQDVLLCRKGFYVYLDHILNQMIADQHIGTVRDGYSNMVEA